MRIYPWLASHRLPPSKFGSCGVGGDEAEEFPRTGVDRYNTQCSYLLYHIKRSLQELIQQKGFQIFCIDCMDRMSRNVR